MAYWRDNWPTAVAVVLATVLVQWLESVWR